jgi:hypothetical protein
MTYRGAVAGEIDSTGVRARSHFFTQLTLDRGH